MPKAACVCVFGVCAFHRSIFLKHFSCTHCNFFCILVTHTSFFPPLFYLFLDSGGWSHASFCHNSLIFLCKTLQPCLQCRAHLQGFQVSACWRAFLFSICSETHVITASCALISHRVCLTLADTTPKVWANCSNHKNPARCTGNTHTLA